MNIVLKERNQFFIYLYLSLAIVGLGLVLYWIDTTPFERFLGDLNPLLVISLSIITGFSLFSYLITKFPFKIYQKKNLGSYQFICGLALLFGVEIIIADIWWVEYAADINIPFPKSLLFYPVIGYIVEVFFHLLPLTIIILILSFFKKLSLNQIVWIGIVSVSILEPLYQMWFTNPSTSFTTIYTGVHVFLFSMTQLLIFKHFDFLSMYLFRMVFYLIWHIGWGHFRLEFLF